MDIVEYVLGEQLPRVPRFERGGFRGFHIDQGLVHDEITVALEDERALAETVRALENLGVQRARSTIHNWVQKAELQPRSGKSPDHVALDVTVIQLTDQRYWLYASVDPEKNEFLHVRLFPARNTAVTEMFIAELSEKHDVDDAVFLVDSGPWLHAALHRRGLRFRYERHGNHNAVERVFQKIKRRTYQFGNCFRNVDPKTAEKWLQIYAYCWNSLI